MAQITLKGNPIETVGELPELGSIAPDFCLVKSDLSEVTLKEFAGKQVVLNIFPSIDTPVCSASVRRFNQLAANFTDTVVLCISADLPFAHQRYCEAEGIENVIVLSVYRDHQFGSEYGVRITTGPIAGMLSRAIVIIDRDGKVVYTQQVPEIGQDPDFESALKALDSVV
jgi:thiol peroxidase